MSTENETPPQDQTTAPSPSSNSITSAATESPNYFDNLSLGGKIGFIVIVCFIAFSVLSTASILVVKLIKNLKMRSKTHSKR